MKFTTTIHDIAYKVLGEHAKVLMMTSLLLYVIHHGLDLQMGGTLPAEEAQQLKMHYRNLSKVMKRPTMLLIVGHAYSSSVLVITAFMSPCENIMRSARN